VRDYLYRRGVPAARLEVVGRAALEPVADNATPDGRAKNRRVEIFLREPPA
jgi:outer membrane protein OmpA-like peptidoglycan-associated protein